MIAVMNIVKDLVDTSGNSKIWFDFVPKNAPLPYYRMQLIASNEEFHKDGNDTRNVNSTDYSVKVPYYTRYRIQIDYITDIDNSLQANVMGLLEDNVQEYIVNSKKYETETLNRFSRHENEDDHQYFIQTLEIYLHEYQ
tara:strand:- start:6013 stop:6429 length:417 start_codon:yes stop_codon:yes gene_type:complete